MSLTVLNVAYPFAPVREDTAGGAEQVIAMLDRALSEGGHRSMVVACEGSKISGKLIGTPAVCGDLNDEARTRTRREYKAAIEETIRASDPDLVHLHGIDFLDYLPCPGVPVLVTLHLPPSWYSSAAFAIARPDTWLHCVSHSQQTMCPNASNFLPFISNGVSEELQAKHTVRRNFALALGRICPEKGFHLAFDAARAACIPFLLAGQVFAYQEHKAYFDREILPRCDRRRRFIGPVGFRRKRRLLNSAKCVLIPSLAPETSSLVAMEAAMCGTPVVAFRIGALPEIVEHGVTGFLVDTETAMANAIRDCDGFNSVKCREVARARFSERRAAAAYLGTYERLRRK